MACIPGVWIGWYRRLHIAHTSEGFSLSLLGFFPCLLPAALMAVISQRLARTAIGSPTAPVIGITLKIRSWYLP
jgi:hypothetical protein